jgi:phage terminase large subunit
VKFEEAQAHIAKLSEEEKRRLDAMLAAEIKTQGDLGRLRTERKWEPRSYQRPLWGYLQSGGTRAAAIWHRRCFVSGTIVTRANGKPCRIEDLAVGDEILSWDGEEIVKDVVKNKWCAGNKPVVRYGATGYFAVHCTSGHRFFGFHPQWEKASWQEADVVVSRRLAVGQFASGLPGTVSAPDLAELVGYLVTDGYVSHDQQPKFTNVDRSRIERVAELATKIFGVTPVIREKGRGWDVGLSNGTKGGGETPNPVKKWFAEQGALGAKSSRRLPAQAWEWDDDSVWRFFGSVLAGDGAIYAQGIGRTVADATRGPRDIAPAAQVSIHAGMSELLATDYAWLLRKVGVAAAISLQRESDWIVRITRQDGIKRLLENVSVLGKEAKRKAALTLCGDRRERQVRYGLEKAGLKRVADIGVEMTWDIETERHGCFFANGYLVHNSGKDDVALNWTAEAALNRVGEYWHLLPEAAQGRKAIWAAVSPHTGVRRIDQAFPQYLRASTRNDEMSISFANGSLWRVVGSDNYNSLVGSTPCGVIISEWALADPAAWAFLRPILLENHGWAIFITTPRGENHAKTTYDLARNDPEWFAELLTVNDTKIFSKRSLDKELKELQTELGDEEGRAHYEQEYFCSFSAALLGAYYGSVLRRAQIEGRIGNVPIDRGVLVHTSWDLGVSDSTAIWFIQCVGKERRLIDYYEGSGVGLDAYAKVLDEKAKKCGISYGIHYFPHDIEVRELGNGGLSRSDTLRNLGIRPKVVPLHNVNDGINATRRLLDYAWIDEKRCERGLAALRQYQRAWNEKTKMFSDAPWHNWASHGSDSLRTFASGHREAKERAPSTTTPRIPEPRSFGRASSTGWMAR